jgi:hypothetical protein
LLPTRPKTFATTRSQGSVEPVRKSPRRAEDASDSQQAEVSEHQAGVASTQLLPGQSGSASAASSRRTERTSRSAHSPCTGVNDSIRSFGVPAANREPLSRQRRLRPHGAHWSCRSLRILT